MPRPPGCRRCKVSNLARHRCSQGPMATGARLGDTGGPYDPPEIPVTASDVVRAFYDQTPYPPPAVNLESQRDLYRNPDRRRALFHRMWPTEAPRHDQSILIAGCGASQAAKYALREPEARVTAIDVSESSLHHTRALQREYALDNLEVHHLAIEQVRELDAVFDMIVCTGALHHLPDPGLGLRALR